MRRLTATLLALPLLLAACGSDDGDEPLRNAGDVREEERAESAIDAEIGEQFEFEGMDVEIIAVAPGGDDSGAWLEVEVRVENSTDDELAIPEFDLKCAGDPEGGGWQADSTFPMYEPLPAKSYEEGVLNLIVPGQPRTGEPNTPCATPAFIEVAPLSYVGEPTIARVAIPDDVIAQVQP